MTSLTSIIESHQVAKRSSLITHCSEGIGAAIKAMPTIESCIFLTNLFEMPLSEVRQVVEKVKEGVLFIDAYYAVPSNS